MWLKRPAEVLEPRAIAPCVVKENKGRFHEETHGLSGGTRFPSPFCLAKKSRKVAVKTPCPRA